MEVIDHLLAAPEVKGPIRLTTPKVLHEYADPDLESRSAGQKVLILGGTGFIGPHFVETIAGRTLNTIKGIVENRDERFHPDGTPR